MGTRGRSIAALAAVVSLLGSTELGAQTDNKLALGIAVITRVASGQGSDASNNLGLDVRLGHGREGWGWATSLFGWFDTRRDTDAPDGTPAGVLRVRPVLVGYGYRWVEGRSTVSANLLGGYSLNSFRVDPRGHGDAIAPVSAEATNALALKPEVQLWYDASSRVGLKLAAGYLISRPSVEFTRALGQRKRAIHADTTLFTVSVVYSLL